MSQVNCNSFTMSSVSIKELPKGLTVIPPYHLPQTLACSERAARSARFLDRHDTAAFGIRRKYLSRSARGTGYVRHCPAVPRQNNQSDDPPRAFIVNPALSAAWRPACHRRRGLVGRRLTHPDRRNASDFKPSKLEQNIAPINFGQNRWRLEHSHPEFTNLELTP